MRASIRFGFLILAAVAATGAFLLPATSTHAVYFWVLDLHRWLGWAASIALPVALAAHLRHTGSRPWGAALAVLAGGLLSMPVLGALDFPEPMSLWALQRQALAGDDSNVALDGVIVTGALALAVLLVGTAATVLVAITQRARERATARWTGIGLTALCLWALAGGLVLQWTPRERLFQALTLHSVAGTGAVALWLIHRFAQKAARLQLGRAPVALITSLALGLVVVSWWWHYEREHFAGFRPSALPERFRVVSTPKDAAARAEVPANPPPLTALSDAASCGQGGCHAAITEQWAGSPHRFSAQNAFYRAAVAEIVAAKGPSASILCANCHDPARVLAGLLPAAYDGGVPERGSDGVSCEVCHAMVAPAREPPGEGHFSVKLDVPYPGDDLAQARRIRLDPRRHRQQFVTHRMTLTSTPCESCHRLRLDDDFGVTTPHTVQNIDLFGSDGPSHTRTCTGCHLPQQEDSLYTHRMAGLNADLLSYALGLEAGDGERLARQAQAVHEFVGLRAAGDIRADPFPAPLFPPTLPEALVRPRNLGVFSLSAEARRDGAELVVALRTLNLGVGHSFPSGPLDLHEVWLELLVRDSNGATIWHEGAPDLQAELAGGLLRLGGDELGPDGMRLRHHRIFELTETRNLRLLGQDLLRDTRRVAVASDASGPFEVRARWLFRRAPPSFVSWATKGGPPLPIWELAAARHTAP